MKQHFIIIMVLFIWLTVSCSSTSEQVDNKTSTVDSSLTKTDSIAKADSLYIKQFIQDYDLNRVDTFTVGDVDGDGKRDKAIIQPLTFFFRNNKMDSQYVIISFTRNIPTIKHYNGFQGLVANVGDLDGNKTDEILYYPDWYQSNSAGIYIYGYRQNKWILISSGSIRRDIIAEQMDQIKYLKSRIKKIDNHSFYLTEHVWTEDGGKIIDSTTIVIIK